MVLQSTCELPMPKVRKEEGQNCFGSTSPPRESLSSRLRPSHLFVWWESKLRLPANSGAISVGSICIVVCYRSVSLCGRGGKQKGGKTAHTHFSLLPCRKECLFSENYRVLRWHPSFGMSFSYWHADDTQPECEGCYRPFSFMVRRHHCRDCGGIFCHDCSSKTVIMYHRASPKAKVRICKYCAPYVEARLTEKMEEERAASLERPGIYNEAFVKNFSSTKRILLAPEDAVHAGYRLNRILQRNEALFLASNDLFIHRHQSSNDEQQDDEEDDQDEDAPPKTVRADRVEGNIALAMHSSPATIKDPCMNFPAASAQDCMSILFESAIPVTTIPSFQRLKDSLKSAHHVAINAEPQTLLAVVQPMFYY